VTRIALISAGIVGTLALTFFALVVATQAVLLPPAFVLGCITTTNWEPRPIYRIVGPAIEAICRYRFTRLAHKEPSPIGLIVAAYPELDLEATGQLIKAVQRNGGDINAYDHIGVTPLHAAVLFNEPEIVTLLLSLGADPMLPRRHMPGMRPTPTDGLNAGDYALWIKENGKGEPLDDRILAALTSPVTGARSNLPLQGTAAGGRP